MPGDEIRPGRIKKNNSTFIPIDTYSKKIGNPPNSERIFPPKSGKEFQKIKGNIIIRKTGLCWFFCIT
jgi:hypothetical protein